MFILPILIKRLQMELCSCLLVRCFFHAMYCVSVHLRVENAYKGANYWSNVIIWIAFEIL